MSCIFTHCALCYTLPDQLFCFNFNRSWSDVWSKGRLHLSITRFYLVISKFSVVIYYFSHQYYTTFKFTLLCCLTSSSPARGSSRPGGRPTQRMTPHRGGFSFTSTREPTSRPGCPLGGVCGRGEGGAAGDGGSGCSPITD